MKIGTIDLGERPVFLAPMEDVTDISFRLMCKRFGADMVYTEFVSADALIRSVNKTQQKLNVADEERPVAIQIYGRDVPTMVEAAQICEAAHPDIPIQYHSHAGPGFNMASILEVCEAGCDYIDVGMEPLSWGTGHADILAVQAMLKDAGFKVKEINMAAYMEVRSQIQEMMDDFLGLYCNPLNRINNSLLIAPGLPGGMIAFLNMFAHIVSVKSSEIVTICYRL